jgi:hypothetical protein
MAPSLVSLAVQASLRSFLRPETDLDPIAAASLATLRNAHRRGDRGIRDIEAGNLSSPAARHYIVACVQHLGATFFPGGLQEVEVKVVDDLFRSTGSRGLTLVDGNGRRTILIAAEMWLHQHHNNLDEKVLSTIAHECVHAYLWNHGDHRTEWHTLAYHVERRMQELFGLAKINLHRDDAMNTEWRASGTRLEDRVLAAYFPRKVQFHDTEDNRLFIVSRDDWEEAQQQAPT